MTTHTSYEFSKKLKAFLGNAAPEPMEDTPKAYYGKDLLCYAHDEKDTAAHKYTFDGFAYQLHDLLSKPFCEAFAKHIHWDIKKTGRGCLEIDVYARVAYHYHEGGLPAVEKALTEMMEGK